MWIWDLTLGLLGLLLATILLLIILVLIAIPITIIGLAVEASKEKEGFFHKIAESLLN